MVRLDFPLSVHMRHFLGGIDFKRVYALVEQMEGPLSLLAYDEKFLETILKFHKLVTRKDIL